MVIAKEFLELPQRLSRISREDTFMPRILTVEEIEKEFGLDKVKPITLTPSEEKVMVEEEDYFKDFYEEELRAIYAKHK